MGSSDSKPLSPKDLDQLLTAIRDIDKSLGRLRKLLHESIDTQSAPEEQHDEEFPPPVRKLLH